MPQLVSGVEVDLRVEQGATPQSTFGRNLCLENVTAAQTTKADVDLRRQARVYSNALAAQTAGETTNVQDAVKAWFGGTRKPQEIAVGTQMLANQPAMIYGDSFTVTAAEALGDSYDVALGSRTISVDLDGLTTAAAVATALQTALNAHSDITGAVVTVYDTDKLQIQLPYDLASIGTFTATADDLGLGPDDEVTYYPGIAAETADDAVARIAGLDPNFTLIALPTDSYNDVTGVETANDRIATLSTWGHSNKRIFEFAEFGAAVLTKDEEATNAALQYDLARRNVAWSYTGDAAGLLPFANQRVLSAIDFTQADTIRNVANRIMPGITPHVLTDEQAAELDRKKGNYYRREGALRHTRGGRTTGEWYEAAYYLLWLDNAVALAAYNYKMSLEAFIGTDRYYAGLREAISVPLRQSVASGAVSPGQVSDAVRDNIRDTTGNRNFNGRLEDGYLVWNAAAATATNQQLNDRDSLPVYFWVKGSPFINNINVNGVYAR